MRMLICLSLLCAACVGQADAKSKATLPDELALTGQNIVEVVIDGQPIRLEVRPEAADAPTLNPDIAIRLGLKPGMIGFRIAVGSEIVIGNSAVHKVDYGVGEKSQRIFWADRASSVIADGTISPASLPYKRVRFILSEPSPSEMQRTVALDNFGFLGRLGVGTTLNVEGEAIRFQFSLQRDETLVSAPTGNWLSQKQDGKFTGQPRQTLIYYGIQRPTRAMNLARPLTVAGSQLATVDVRYTDYGDASGIAAEDSAAADQDEIVVVGKKDKKRSLAIVAGRRFLSGCSSLLYDFQQRNMVLSCKAN